ncbi:WD domain-containing protein [Botrytis cinerea]
MSGPLGQIPRRPSFSRPSTSNSLPAGNPRPGTIQPQVAVLSGSSNNGIPRPGAPRPPFPPYPGVPPPSYLPHSPNSVRSYGSPYPLVPSPSSARDFAQVITNADAKVIEYLVKKGYNRTEQMLRSESSNLDRDGKPIQERAEDLGTAKYAKGFRLLSNWIESNLDIYKFELRRLLWPIFVYSFIELITNNYTADGKDFLKEFKDQFQQVHADELTTFDTISLPQQINDNTITKLYLSSKYRIPLNTHVYFNLITHLESNSKQGGSVIIYLLQTYCEIRETKRGPIDQFSFEAIINQAHGVEPEESDLQEGIPGAFTGVTNKDIQDNNAKLLLGPMALEDELAADLGKPSLVELFDQSIKREEGVEGPGRNEIPYPPSRARDVTMEVQKIKEHRDRFKIESRNGGVGPAVSICMFTFHNTLDTINCIEFSDDNNLVAVGTEESYIRVWHLHGDPLPSETKSGPNDPPPSNSRRLIGHSAPVYAVSFSPSIRGADESDTATAPKLLLSSSSDRTIRLWSLEAWACLVVYKGHEGPVWNVKWGPFGHYFLTCGHDRSVRIWGQDHISYLRMFIGHDSNVNQIAWHPNGAYVFSASDQADKTVRMWSFTTGDCVRVFTGHTDTISALQCAPNGKILASADCGGSIILWDLAKGTQIKRCRGHGKGGIWSLSFSVESTVLCSGGADGTVRLWDIEVPSDPYKNNDGEVIGTGGQADATRVTGAITGAQANPTTGSSKKKGKETMITPDQIVAFPTKRSPVYKVMFTRMNLVMAGGCYLP